MFIAYPSFIPYVNHCRMLINSDQNSGIDPDVDQCWPIPINSSQCRSMQDQAVSSQIWHWLALIDIDWHWSALVMRSSKISTSGRTWPCLVVKTKCFGYALLLPLVMDWQFLLMFYWCLDPELIAIDDNIFWAVLWAESLWNVPIFCWIFCGCDLFLLRICSMGWYTNFLFF